MKITEGKTKKLTSVKNYKNLVLLVFKDVLTKNDSKLVFKSFTKSQLVKDITFRFMKLLELKGVPTHFTADTKNNKGFLRVKYLKMIPLEVVVRFRAYGSYSRRNPEAKPIEVLTPPVLEFFFKQTHNPSDPLISEKCILIGKFCTEEQLERIKELALKSAELIRGVMNKENYILFDIKFEFGLDENGEVTLGDEISPDTFRYKNISNLDGEVQCIESFDKDIYREASEGKPDEEIRRHIIYAYKTVLRLISLQESFF